jgi:hypothetical protein
VAIVVDTTSISGVTIVYDDANGGVAIDYSTVLGRIATALETVSQKNTSFSVDTSVIEEKLDTIATNSEVTSEQITTMASNSNVIKEEITTIATQLTPVTPEAQTETLADQIARFRYLADPNSEEVNNDNNHGIGIPVTNPFGYLGLGVLYQLYVKQAQILEDNDISPEQQAEALQQLNSVLNEMVNNLARYK